MKLLCLFALVSGLCFAQKPDLMITDVPASNLERHALAGSVRSAVAQFVITNNATGVIELTQFTVLDATTAPKSLTNIQLWMGSAFIGQSVATATVTQGYTHKFVLSTLQTSTLFVPAANSSNPIVITLRGDIPQDAQENAIHQLQIIDSASIQGINHSTGAAIKATAAGYGSAIRILKSDLSVDVFGRTNSAGILYFSNLGTALAINKLAITVSPAPQTPVSFDVNLIELRDNNGVEVTLANEAVKTVSGNSITWIFPDGFKMVAGGQTPFAVVSPTPIKMAVQNVGDVIFTDATNGTGTAGVAIQFASPIKITDDEN